jgi:hypothetical protein
MEYSRIDETINDFIFSCEVGTFALEHTSRLHAYAILLFNDMQQYALKMISIWDKDDRQVICNALGFYTQQFSQTVLQNYSCQLFNDPNVRTKNAVIDEFNDFINSTNCLKKLPKGHLFSVLFKHPISSAPRKDLFAFPITMASEKPYSIFYFIESKSESMLKKSTEIKFIEDNSNIYHIYIRNARAEITNSLHSEIYPFSDNANQFAKWMLGIMIMIHEKKKYWILPYFGENIFMEQCDPITDEVSLSEDNDRKKNLVLFPKNTQLKFVVKILNRPMFSTKLDSIALAHFFKQMHNFGVSTTGLDDCTNIFELFRKF